MQAVIGDDSFDAAQTDGEVSLPELLGEDLRRRIGIQKAIAQDLADHLVGAAIIGFGAGFLGLQGGETALPEGLEYLVIALATIAILLSNSADLSFQTLTFDEHEEAASHLVGGGDGQGPSRAGELMDLGIESEGRIHTEQISDRRVSCLIDCGGTQRRKYRFSKAVMEHGKIMGRLLRHILLDTIAKRTTGQRY